MSLHTLLTSIKSKKETKNVTGAVYSLKIRWENILGILEYYRILKLIIGKILNIKFTMLASR